MKLIQMSQNRQTKPCLCTDLHIANHKYLRSPGVQHVLAPAVRPMMLSSQSQWRLAKNVPFQILFTFVQMVIGACRGFSRHTGSGEFMHLLLSWLLPYLFSIRHCGVLNNTIDYYQSVVSDWWTLLTLSN